MIELLAVILAIGILFAILMPAVGRLRYRAWITDADSVTATIRDAILQYRFEYGGWPFQFPSGTVDDTITYSANNHEVIDYLQLNHPSNLKRILFLHIEDYTRDADGSIIDPWGRPYIIVFDMVNNKVDVSYPNPP